MGLELHSVQCLCRETIIDPLQSWQEAKGNYRRMIRQRSVKFNTSLASPLRNAFGLSVRYDLHAGLGLPCPILTRGLLLSEAAVHWYLGWGFAWKGPSESSGNFT